jgi:hypothetical protein
MSIEVNLSLEELLFIKSALTEKYEGLMDRLTDAEVYTTDPFPNLTEEEFLAQVEAIKEEEKIFNYKPVGTQAPYGVKKDGTPKKKPGRPIMEMF